MQSRLTLGCLLAVLVSGNLAQAAVEPVSSLLERVRIGEATGREDLVSNALYSLSLVEPEHPELLAAKARQALRSGKIKEAEALLARLGTLAPDSRLYRLGMANLAVNNGAQRQQLQQARLLVNAGRLEEGAKLYRSLFVDGVAPNLEMAIEYASLQLRLPGQRAKGMAGLEALNRAYPGQPRIRAALARNYLADDRWQEARVLLEQMARSEYDRGEAAEIWLANIKELPVGPGSLAELRRYVAAFGTGTEAKQGMALLAEQEAEWASPAYRARQQALASNEGGKASIAELQRALAANPDDPELMGALGQAYSRNNQRALAIAQFERLLRHPDVTNKDKWTSLLATNRYWLLIDQAEQAAKRQQGEEARALYRQAIKQDGREPEAWLGLGDAELALHREAEAEAAYRKALGLGARDRALARLFELYKEKDPEQALALLARSRDPAWQQEAGRLRSELLQSQADTLDQAGKLEQALAQREQALTLTPDGVWLAYRVAVTRARLGDAPGGEKLLRDKLAARPQEISLRYATALYLSGQDKNTEARELLAAVPAKTWSADMRELDERLARGEVLVQARALHERGDERGAEGLLRPLLPDEEVSLILAEWAVARGDWTAAEGYYREVLARSPQQAEARLGMAELMQARGDEAQALDWLPVWPVSPLPADEFNFYRRVANLYQALGQEEKAQAIFATYEPLVRGQPASEQTALFWRDAARQRFDAGDTEGAIERDRKGLVAAGLAPREDLDGAELTRLARSRDGEGWLASGLRSDLDRHYRQSQTTVSLDSDYWGSSGTGGLSDLRALTQMLQLDTPLAGGTFFGRLELVDMDAGKLPASPYREEFGTCAARDCYGQEHQQNTGTTLAAGWHGGAWAFDLGTTPLGFEVVDWVGGATVEGDLGDLGWGLTLSRRPVSSSLLSYSGTVDPGTGIRWGGVRANGVRLDLSHDLGGAIGFWGSAQQHLLTGKNVPDNWRTRLMGGTYYKLVNETNRRVSVGLSSMLWHYQKDLSGYTLGQGGYYSPQGYFSLSVPVNYRQRTADWSWELGGSGSWSHSRTDDSRRYPLEGLLPAGLPDRDAPVKGGSSSGFGYTLNAIVEHRLTDHWRIGGRVDIQQADDYAPSHATLFLRYTFKPWQGDLDMPPQPLTPYADFD